MVQLIAEHQGGDNRRWEVCLDDDARVEAVLYRGDSLCVSSQVGCAVGCPFCASGANGFGRNLELEELVGQVKAVEATGARVSRVTVSGVGEPLHNHHNVASFARWCADHDLGLTLTTSGGPLRRLRAWMELPHRGLTLSVHSGTEATRAKMVPKGPPLAQLFDTVRDELGRISNMRRKRLALAYLLIKDRNDSDAEFDAFLDRVDGLGIKIHLYAYNPVPTNDLEGITEERYTELYERVRARGLDVRKSSQARVQENGGCGTLVAVRKDRRVSGT